MIFQKKIQFFKNINTSGFEKKLNKNLNTLKKYDYFVNISTDRKL